MIEKLFSEIGNLIARKLTGTITIEIWSGKIVKFLFLENMTNRLK